MRLWLLCGVLAAVATVGTGRANHGDTSKGTSLGGHRRPHRPCSGCFSVLSEEWQSAPRDEDSAGTPGVRDAAEPVPQRPRTRPAAVRPRKRHDRNPPAGPPREY